MILTNENNFDANTWSKPDVNIKVVLTFLKIMLTLSNFVFNGMNYLHKKKIALWALNVRLAMQIFSQS